MGGHGGEGTAVKKCGMTQTIIFLIALVAGSACSICSKTMMELHGEGMTGEIEKFSKPIFQTIGMFIGMMFGLVMHWIVLIFKIPFPGYSHLPPPPKNYNNESGVPTEKDALIANKDLKNGDDSEPEYEVPLPLWMYGFLAIPSIFDLAATALCMMGLVYVDVSIYQLLRGSGIVFVAIMKQHILKDKLFKFQWIGVIWNVCSVFLVGATAILNSLGEQTRVEPGEALLGVLLVLLGAFVQALQFVFEEKVMTMDIPVKPLLLIGMEGLWGTILCVIVIYPLAYYLPGDDHGSYECPFNTWHMISHSATIRFSYFVYFWSIFGYNLFAVLVTYMLNSVWHAILDNFRPITIWSTSLFIFYVIDQASGDHGEPWTKWSFIQAFGMAVLLYGTAVYNAPNSGSIELRGQWYALGMDMSHEYSQINFGDDDEDAILDEEWAKKQEEFKKRRGSSFLGEHSPHMSVHTQALRGLASPKI